MILNPGGRVLPNLDAMAFGEQTSLPAEGRTDPAYYEAIADAIAQRSAEGGITLVPLSVTANGSYTPESGQAYSEVTVAVPSEGGLEILVTVTGEDGAPASGAVVTASKDGATYTGVETATEGTYEISVPEYGTYTVTATKNGKSISETVTLQKESLVLSFPTVVGVCWDYSNDSTVLQRLTAANDPNGYVNTDITTEPVAAVGAGAGSSPFDHILPWSGMYECNHNGTEVTYRKGEAGFSRTANDTVIWIPEFYVKIINDVANSKTYYYTSSGSKDGFTKMEGSGKFVARYMTGTGYVTKSGFSPQVNMTRATCRTQSKAKGGKWRMTDFAAWCAYTYLYLVEFADWNSQAKLGMGYTVGNSAPTNTGGTDSMTYHTGSAGDKTTGKYSVQYRGIEDPFGNVYEWEDGINFYNRTAYICTDPTKYADDTSTGYTDTSVTICSSAWIKKLTPSTTGAWAFFLPTEGGGSETTYVPDYVYSDAGWRAFFVGGRWDESSRAGLFYFCASYSSSYSYSSIGARLLVDP